MRAGVLATVMLGIATPALAQSPSDGIAAANRQFEQAFDRGDAAALAQLYTENASVLPPGAPMATGREAIQYFWQGAIARGFKNLSLHSVSIATRGDAAREIGQFSLDVPGAQGQTSRVEGKYVVIWRDLDGWKLDTDIWNMNK